MTSDDLGPFLAAFDGLPCGAVQGHALGRRYVATKSQFANGASEKLVAEQLGGSDYISLNLYRTANGALLRPCEMPAQKVIDFVLAFAPDPSPKAGT